MKPAGGHSHARSTLPISHAQRDVGEVGYTRSFRIGRQQVLKRLSLQTWLKVLSTPGYPKADYFSCLKLRHGGNQSRLTILTRNGERGDGRLQTMIEVSPLVNGSYAPRQERTGYIKLHHRYQLFMRELSRRSRASISTR